MSTDDLPDQEDIQSFLDFLSKEPPYEAIGRVIHAAADLETGIFQLCRSRGLAHDKVYRKDAGERVKWLKVNSSLDHAILDRVGAALQRRNLLAHGQWLHVKGSDIFVKIEKDQPDHLVGENVDEKILKQWCDELRELADYTVSAYLTLRAAKPQAQSG
jgi:hypothetical protein